MTVIKYIFSNSKIYSILVLYLSFCNVQVLSNGLNYSYNYAKVRNVPSDLVSYPKTLQGPSTHGPSASSILQETLRINGQTYNISEALGPQIPYPTSSIKPDKVEPKNVNSARDSNSNYKLDAANWMAVNKEDIAFTTESSDIDDNTTPAPISGAIDYVLLPLVILAVAGPIFVVMYIVMGSIEYKLPPQVQQRSSVNNRHTYFDMNAIIRGARPVMGVLYETVSRALEYQDCRDKTACQMGTYGKRLRNKSVTIYEYLERFVRSFIPQRYSQPLSVYMASARSEIDNCSKYQCFY